MAEIGENVYIHPSVEVPDDLVIGDNSRIFNFVKLASEVEIGHGTTIGALTNFEAGCKVGNHVTVYSQSHLTTGLLVEDYVWIGPMFLGLNTKRIRHVRDFELEIEPPHLKFGARIGARVTLMPGVTIGNEALLDSCSVVTKDVPAGEIWRGFPAKKVGDVPMEDYIGSKQESKCQICMERRKREGRY